MKKKLPKLGSGGDPTKYNLNKKGSWSPVVWNGDMYDSMVRNGVIGSDTLSRPQFSKYSLDQVTNLVNSNPDFLRVQNGTSSTNNWGKTFLAKDGYTRPTPTIPQPLNIGNTLQGYETDWQPGQQGSGNVTKMGNQVYLPPKYGGGGPFAMPDFGQLNNLDNLTPNTLAGAPEMPGGGMGSGGGADAIAQGAGMTGQVMGPIISAIRGVKDLKMQDIYGDASNELRQVDVKQMGKLNKTFIGLASGREGRAQARLFNEGIIKQQFNKDVGNRMSTMEPQQSYMPVAKQGGFTVYKGESHSGPNGGIFTDEQGNPTGLSNNQPIALTENNEVARFNPDTNSTYIYSDSLGFAKPANDLVNKYKLNKSTSEYKYNPLLKTAVDKQFDNLQTAQEFAKETKTPAKDAVGMFKNGGMLTQHKAEEMMKDGTAHGKKLTPKQRKYFNAVAHGMTPNKEEGGLLELHEGGPVGHTHRPDRPDYYYDRYGTPHLMPELLEQRIGGEGNFINPNNSIKQSKSNVVNTFDPNKWSSTVNDVGLPPILNPGKLNEWKKNQPKFIKGKGWVYPINPQNKNVPNQQINNISPNIQQLQTNEGWGLTPEQSGYGEGVVRTGVGKTTPDTRFTWAGNIGGMNQQLGDMTSKFKLYNPTPQLDKDGRVLSGLAPAPTNINNQNNGQYNPTLSPLGHIASAVGSLADYNAMGKAKPKDVSLPRVGAERISLASQRIANDRNAATSRAINATTARGLGMNAGATFTNTNVANTGVNRLLGQQNAESLMTEENTNAQLRQQANMMNSELGAQESLFNTQQSNAYRMLRAQMNPLGNLSRIAASYAKDNSAYGQGYDTLKMLAPNANLSAPEDENFLKWLVGSQRPQVKLR